MNTGEVVAGEGETLVTLDDVEREMTADDLLICDTERPVAIAGVMGGYFVLYPHSRVLTLIPDEAKRASFSNLEFSRQVLRGACEATSATLAHPRYRNFFEPHRTDIYSGFRTCAAA